MEIVKRFFIKEVPYCVWKERWWGGIFLHATCPLSEKPFFGINARSTIKEAVKFAKERAKAMSAIK